MMLRAMTSQPRAVRWLALAALFIAAQAAADPAQWLESAREESGAPAMGMVIFDADGVRNLAVAGERAQGSGVAVEVDDPWHLGSNIKAMTALLVAILAERGELAWSDSLGEVLEGRVDEIHPDWRKVDYRQLLGHCSGMPANAGRWTSLRLMGDETRDDAADRLTYLGSLLGEAPQSATGETFNYSNAGYVAVGAMLEATTGEDWKTLMRRELFEPLELASAGFGPPGRKGRMDAPRGHAAGLLGGLSAAEPGATADNPPALNPAGRVHMNLRDYATLLGEFLRGLDGGGKLLDEDGYRQLITTGCNEDYALGWGVADDGSLAHNGSNTMWFARARLWADKGVGMVVVSNDGRLNRQREAFDGLYRRAAPLLGSEPGN